MSGRQTSVGNTRGLCALATALLGGRLLLLECRRALGSASAAREGLEGGGGV